MSISSTQVGFSINAEQFNAQITKEIQQLGMETARVFAGIVENAFVYLVYETPQWSGSMAASWNLGINRKRNTLSIWPDPKTTGVSPLQKGALGPIAESLGRAKGAGKLTFKGRFVAGGWNINVTNPIHYAADVNAGTVKLRSEVGHSPGFVERFEARVASAQVGIGSSWNYYANTSFL